MVAVLHDIPITVCIVIHKQKILTVVAKYLKHISPLLALSLVFPGHAAQRHHLLPSPRYGPAHHLFGPPTRKAHAYNSGSHDEDLAAPAHRR